MSGKARIHVHASAVAERRAAGVSIVTAVCDEPPAGALERWAADEAVDEIVVVDFGGASAVPRDAFSMPKTIVVRAGAREPWAKGLALNVGVSASSRETILVLDPGFELRFIGAHRNAIAANGGYLTGYGTDKAQGSEIAIFRHADWESVGGFHEYLLGWGFEDEDLFNRLEDSGVLHRFFQPDDVVRSSGERVPAIAADIGIELPDGLDRQPWFQANRNKILAGLAPWSPAMSSLRPRRFGRPGAGIVTCDIAPRTKLERRLQDCASYLAARFLHDVPEKVAFPLLARMIDERSGFYAARAGRQHQIDRALAATRPRGSAPNPAGGSAPGPASI